jgi:hypothetical protein
MINSHPTDKEIQQFAIDKSACSAAMAGHIESCVFCLQEAETYQALFDGIKKQPQPAFDFDLPGLVLSQLPESGSRLSADDIIAGFLVIFTCCCIGIPVYLFRKIILNMFMDIPPFFIYAIIISTTGILIIKILSLYKKYLNQMRFLNFN